MAASAPAWRQALLSSLSRQSNQKTASFVQLATVRPDGTPANRTVVYRGFLGDSCQMLFFSDTRSAKVQETATNPAVEVCWYLPDTWEQFRIQGLAEVVDSQHSNEGLMQMRESAWAGLSERQKGTWRGGHPGTRKPSPKGQDPPALPPGPEGREAAAPCPSLDTENGSRGDLLGASSEGKISLGQSESSGGNVGDALRDPELPLECFCLVVLKPHKVDYLSIKEDLRILHTVQGQADVSYWESVELYP